APACGGQPSRSSTLPSPSASRLGRSRPPTARATLPSVSDPSSPNSAASGNAPAPTASSTITHARGIGLFYGAGAHAPWSRRARDLRPVRDRSLGRGDGAGRPHLPERDQEAAADGLAAYTGESGSTSATGE